MIPKTIHYCWFGGNPLPPLAKKCIESWKKYCPDYEIIEWNETNYDVETAPIYVRQAYEEKQWAFVSDYVRLQIIFAHGGIYLDTDVELLKSLDPFLDHNAYFGIESEAYGIMVATGLGFGAEKNSPVVKAMMEVYLDIPFVLPDGTFDKKPCPRRNTEAIKLFGFIEKDENQLLEGDIAIFSSKYFCPMSFSDGVLHRTKDTCSIHHFSGAWRTKEQAQKQASIWKAEKRRRIKNFPFRFARALLGNERYEIIRKRIKR